MFLVMESVTLRPQGRWRAFRTLTVAVQSADDEEDKKKAAAAGQRSQNQRRAKEQSLDSPWKKAGLVAVGATAVSLLSRLIPNTNLRLCCCRTCTPALSSLVVASASCEQPWVFVGPFLRRGRAGLVQMLLFDLRRTKVRELTSTKLGHRPEPEFFTPK